LGSFAGQFIGWHTAYSPPHFTFVAVVSNAFPSIMTFRATFTTTFITNWMINHSSLQGEGLFINLLILSIVSSLGRSFAIVSKSSFDSVVVGGGVGTFTPELFKYPFIFHKFPTLIY